MLNRTNRTLSANLNRLNLGTRSLAIVAGVNNGDQTLRIRHVHRDVMHDGMPGYQSAPISIRRGAITPFPSSSSVSPWLVSSRVVRVRVDFAAVSFADADRSCLRGNSQERSLERFPQPRESAKRDRKPLTGKRWHEGHVLGNAPARATLASAAASLAAAGG